MKVGRRHLCVRLRPAPWTRIPQSGDSPASQAGARILAATGHESSAGAVAFDADGSTLASADRSGRVLRWDLRTAPEGRVVGGQDGSVTFGFSRDATAVWTASKNGPVRWWDARTGEARPVVAPPVEGEPSLGLPFGERTAIRRTSGDELVAFDVADGREVGRIRRPAPGVHQGPRVLAPDGRILVSVEFEGDRRGRIRFLDLRTGEASATFAEGEPIRTAFALAPDGGAIRRVLEVEGPAYVTALTFAPGGGRVAAAFTNGSSSRVAAWDAATGERVFSVERLPFTVNDLAYGPGGRRLALASQSIHHGVGGVRLWDAETGREFHALAREASSVGRLVWSRDGARLAALVGLERSNVYERGPPNVRVWSTVP